MSTHLQIPFRNFWIVGHVYVYSKKRHVYTRPVYGTDCQEEKLGGEVVRRALAMVLT